MAKRRRKPAAEKSPAYSPQISRIELEGLDPIDVPAGAIVFVVGPNNGGKSTFLRELSAKVGRVSDTKWISKLHWDLGSEDQWNAYVDEIFEPEPREPNLIRERITGARIHKSLPGNFYVNQTIDHTSFLIRMLSAEGRIGLANGCASPDVTDKTVSHPYHKFFHDPKLEAEFSNRVRAAFNKDFRVNRTGNQVHGHLGQSPTGHRLSEAYEHAILTKMSRIDMFGDGVRSYIGILLNSLADAKPVTIIDEPEAFLHPPQARRLGNEMAISARDQRRQVFVATHSADFIQGALQAQNPNTLFLYLDHSTARKIFIVDRAVVEGFSKKPFLSHTNALDALFYAQAVICEGEADIMFFKWALEGSDTGKQLQESFWISSYGKSAIPGMLEDMAKLGIRTRAIFDLDVLLSPDILSRICRIIGMDYSKYEGIIKDISKAVKVPPAAETLQSIGSVIRDLDTADDDEPSRLEAIRKVKRSAESLGKSWVLKSSGLSALGRGQIRSAAQTFIQEMRDQGIVILEEGEIENYVPEIGNHGQAWVRSALEQDQLSAQSRATIERQLAEGLLCVS